MTKTISLHHKINRNAQDSSDNFVNSCYLHSAIISKDTFQENGRFPNTHVSGSKAMRKRGIGCVQSQDRAAQHLNPHAIPERQSAQADAE